MSEERSSCEACGAALPPGQVSGNRPRYCSNACRQRAYRRRQRTSGALPLPQRIDRFVGRRRELSQLAALLRQPRLVTLVGPPGAGKTRLAVELANRIHGRYPDGVHLVQLHQLSRRGRVVPAVAAALGVAVPRRAPTVDALAAALAGRTALLVLDTCEHLLGDCAQAVPALARHAPGVSVLATSREPLRMTGETEYPVPPLGLPPDAGSVPDLLRSEAVELFVERAGESAPGFALTEANAAAVATLCRRLDGLPLALELAARTVRVLPPETIVSRLHDRFAVLTTGARTAPPRHRSLWAAITWSYELLSPSEQAAFRRLSVFAGAFDAGAATAVLSGLDGGPADLLAALQSRSLVLRPAGEPEPARLRMLESIRGYAHRQLLGHPDADAAHDRHVEYLAGLARPVFDCAGATDAQIHRLRAARDDLALVVERLVTGPDERQLLLASALVLARWRDSAAPDTGTLIDHALGNTAADAPYRGAALGQAAWLAVTAGHPARARELAREAVALQARRADRPGRLALAYRVLGRVYAATGDRAAAVAALRHAVATNETAADPVGTAVLRYDLAWQVLRQGDPVGAARIVEPVGPVFDAAGDERMVGRSRYLAGMIALAMDDPDTAATHFGRALPVPGSQPYHLAGILDAYGVLATRAGAGVRALRLFGAARALRGPAQPCTDPWWPDQVARAHETARAALPGEQAGRAWTAGGRLDTRQALDYALRDVWPDPCPGGDTRYPLSPREWQVARLSATGLGNADVAARLNLSVRSVEGHLHAIRTKLGLGSRAQVAAWAVGQVDVSV